MSRIAAFCRGAILSLLPCLPALAESPGTYVEPSDASLLEQIDRDNRWSADALRREVDLEVRRARSMMATEPTKAAGMLRSTLAHVERAAELSATIKLQLHEILHSAMREPARQSAVRDNDPSVFDATQRRAMGVQQQLAVRRRDDERIRQMTSKFDALTREGRYGEAGEQADALSHATPNSPLAISASMQASARGNHADELARRAGRFDGVLEMFAGEERSAAPSDTAIRYPDARQWREMSKHRKATRVDLKNWTTAEAKIQKVLHEPTTLEFVGTPLSDVADYLKDLCGVEVQLDTVALQQLGLESDAPVFRKVSGIRLGSALHLILRDLGLTYVMDHEVLLITSPEHAQSVTILKVYPVGDLFMPTTFGLE